MNILRKSFQKTSLCLLAATLTTASFLNTIEAIAAPTDFLTVLNSNSKGWGMLLDLLPNADALKNTTSAIKEYIGLFVNQLAD